ncbi:MAG: helix-turn-helix domain-containing protein, partial [Chloroflexota bacterium]|nr:helix-turn-helix domain-containing protein [Chloroflexota bacterium]
MSDRDGTSFGDLLLRLRKEAGLTQEELAERAGLSRDAISALEAGRRRHPHPHTVQSLANALGLRPAETQALLERAPRPRRSGYAQQPERPASNLPSPATALVGRARELADLRALLDRRDTRLVTITGPAGVGKSRLALELAHDLAGRIDGPTIFVPLAAIHDASQVLPAIARPLGVREAAGEALDDRVRNALREGPTLLLLDNLEHLDEAYATIGRLLRDLPDLTILATSQTALRITGEQEYPLSPLATPRPGAAGLAGNDAVQLFIQRARAVQPGFALTPANTGPIARICARLDGLPLAIELAAARVKVLPPEAMLSRLSSRLDLPAGGPRDQEPRLQSLRAALEWSYDLLEPWEADLLRVLSVFADSFSLEAAEAVLAGLELDRPGVTVLDGLASLVDKSLLRSLPPVDGEARFGMLGTVREYARERSVQRGEREAIRSSHAAVFLEMAERGYAAFRQRDEHERWLNRLETERGNLSDALEWLHERGDSPSLARMAGALWWFWDIRGPLSEGRAWLERSLADDSPDIPDELRFQVMMAAGQLAHFQGDDAQARIWSEAAYVAMPDSTDPWVRATPIMLLGLMAEDSGDYALAEVRFSDALRLWQEADDPVNTALAIHHLGVTAWGMGDV